jgi:hypothetical protein
MPKRKRTKNTNNDPKKTSQKTKDLTIQALQKHQIWTPNFLPRSVVVFMFQYVLSCATDVSDLT